MKERTATAITLTIFAFPLFAMVSYDYVKNIGVMKSKPVEIVKTVENYSTEFSKPRFVKVTEEHSLRWGNYPLYMSIPNQTLPKTFEVKTIADDVCKHYRNDSGYTYGTFHSIGAYGLSWMEYKGRWIAFSQVRSEGKGYGRNSITPGWYPYCAAGMNTKSVKFKIYVGDRESLVEQHLREKATYKSQLEAKDRKFQADVAQVGL